MDAIAAQKALSIPSDSLCVHLVSMAYICQQTGHNLLTTQLSILIVCQTVASHTLHLSTMILIDNALVSDCYNIMMPIYIGCGEHCSSCNPKTGCESCQAEN